MHYRVITWPAALPDDVISCVCELDVPDGNHRLSHQGVVEHIT